MGNIQSVRELFETCKDMKEGFVFAIMTDKILCDAWPLKGTEESEYAKREGMSSDTYNLPLKGTEESEDSERRVLEIRIFNKECEHKLFRSKMGQSFNYRFIHDSGKEALKANEIFDFYDELQYLDIDTTEKPEQKYENLITVQATGGGVHNLPLQVDICSGDHPFEKLEYAVLKVRHYISKYEETGKAYVCDWRCVGIYPDEKEAGKSVKSWEGGE